MNTAKTELGCLARNAWIPYVLLVGLFWGTSNTIYGVSIAQIFFWGFSYTAPGALIALVLIRLIVMCKTVKPDDAWFSKKSSNYWRAQPQPSRSADQGAAGDQDGDEPQYYFDWKIFFIVIFTQGLPMISGLFLIGIAFKLAFMAQINQGVITVMLGLTSVFTGIIFYFKFGEVLSFVKIVGMLLMIGAGVFLSIDDKEDEEVDDQLTEAEMKRAGVFSVGIVSLCALAWTLLGYYYKKLTSTGRFSPFDLAWDGVFCGYFIAFIIHVIYIAAYDELDASFYAPATFVGVFQVTGQFLMLLSYQTGPGGAIQALIALQTFWQVAFDAIFLDQTISLQQWLGMAFGFISTLLLSVGDTCVSQCTPRSIDQAKEDKQAQALEPILGGKGKEGPEEKSNSIQDRSE